MYIYLNSFQDSRYINSSHIPSHFPTTKKKKRKPRSGTIDWQEFLQLLGVVAEGFWWKGRRCENLKPSISFQLSKGGVQDFGPQKTSKKHLNPGCFHGSFSATGKVKRLILLLLLLLLKDLENHGIF